MKTTKKYRVTRIGRGAKRSSVWMSDAQLKKFRAKRLKAIRKDELGLTQKEFADAVGVSLRTLQDWEMGRNPMPKPVELLLSLMREMPKVKRRLLVA